MSLRRNDQIKHFKRNNVLVSKSKSIAIKGWCRCGAFQLKVIPSNVLFAPAAAFPCVFFFLHIFFHVWNHFWTNYLEDESVIKVVADFHFANWHDFHASSFVWMSNLDL